MWESAGRRKLRLWTVSTQWCYLSSALNLLKVEYILIDAVFMSLLFTWYKLFVHFCSFLTIMDNFWIDLLKELYSLLLPEAATRGGPQIKLFLEISQNLQENICARVLLSKVAVLGLQLHLKRDSGTGVFLRILQNFWEHLFTEHLRTTASILRDGCLLW